MEEERNSKLNRNDSIFAVSAEKEGYERPILLRDLIFGRLLDEVVIPYEKEENFFVDGVPLNSKTLKRIKIILVRDSFKSDLDSFLWKVDHWHIKIKKDEYDIRLDAILRYHGEDVTSLVISAYQRGVRDKVKEWLPKREQLTAAAWNIFMEGAKFLATGGA